MHTESEDTRVVDLGLNESGRVEVTGERGTCGIMNNDQPVLEMRQQCGKKVGVSSRVLQPPITQQEKGHSNE